MTSEDPKKAAKDIADRVAEVSGDAASSAKAAAANVSDGVRDFAARTGDAASEIYGKAQDRVRDTVEHLPDPSEAMAVGRRAYEKSSDTVGRHVAKQPLEALLLAGAIGYLVGWATNRS